MNLYGVAQMLTANTTGGPEARECFGIRALARYTKNAWKMLVPECAMPRSSRHRSRWQFAVDGETTAVQVAFLTDAQARVLATVQTVQAPQTCPATQERVQDVPASQQTPRTRSDLDSSASTSPEAAESSDAVPADPLVELVTLGEAINAGIVEGTDQLVKKRIQRTTEATRPQVDVPWVLRSRVTGLHADHPQRGQHAQELPAGVP